METPSERCQRCWSRKKLMTKLVKFSKKHYGQLRCWRDSSFSRLFVISDWCFVFGVKVLGEGSQKMRMYRMWCFWRGNLLEWQVRSWCTFSLMLLFSMAKQGFKSSNEIETMEQNLPMYEFLVSQRSEVTNESSWLAVVVQNQGAPHGTVKLIFWNW